MAPGHCDNRSGTGFDPRSGWSNVDSSNATLGFGAIFVVTEDPNDWRIQGLVQAANLTGLAIQVPVQKHLTDDEVFEQVKIPPQNGWGHARAFLSHLSVLDTFSRLDVETALILEDDVDFGVDIRHQMELLSHAIWDHSGERAFLSTLHPYRDDEWDIFWIGHCAVNPIPETDIFEYDDPHALPWRRLSAEFNEYYKELAEGTTGSSRQQVMFNAAAICSHAYATTRTHAARMVERYLRKGMLLKDGNSFEWSIRRDCESMTHRCVAPVPELFHHHRVAGEMSINQPKIEAPEVKQNMTWYGSRHKYTYNIEWSARCNAAHAGERLGDRWQCLPNKDDPKVGGEFETV